MIGFLRFVGVMNAAIWLGGTVFFSFTAAPAFVSPEMRAVLGESNFPYFSGAIAQVTLKRCFSFQLTCAIVAWCHLLAEWLYFGRPSRKISFALLIGLLFLVLVGGQGIQPKLEKLHRSSYAVNLTPAQRQDSTYSFVLWRRLAWGVNVVTIGALMLHLWRTAHPVNSPRFISSVKFRG